MFIRIARGAPERLETLQPVYFALVMATGIIALALHLHGLTILALVLIWLNLVQFAVLVIVFAMRLRSHFDAFVDDLSSHARGFGFFTWVAAPGVLGEQAIRQLNSPGLAMVFWIITALAWLLTTYGVVAAIIVRRDKPRIADGLNGGWLVLVVAGQALSILTVLLAAAGAWGGATQAMVFAALALWLSGGVLYVWIMGLIFLRYTFRRTRPEDLTSTYWIDMGAAAISTVAGVTLAQNTALAPAVSDLLVFVKGMTLLFWSVGTWWIPMLLVLGVWRFVMQGAALSYTPLYWGAVFPLGMYSVCTIRLGEILPLQFLVPLASAFTVIAVIAWAATYLGLLECLVRSLRHLR